VPEAGALRGGCGQTLQRCCLGSSAASGSQLADVVEEDGPLQRVQLRGVVGDLGEEGIGHENGGLIAVAIVGVAQQGGDIDLKSAGQPVKRRKRRHGLAVLDLGDVGAGNAHASGQLTLRQVAHVAQVANGCGYLYTALLGCCRGDESEWGWSWFGLLDLEAFVAAAAQRIGRPELHQTAMIATQYLTLFDRCHHGCHKLSCSEGTQSKDPAHVR
jgi:hypothetical protein